MLIQDKVDAVFIPDSPSRIKATDYNQIKNEIQECISSAGLTPTKDVIQLPQALKILTAQSGAEEVAKIEAAGAAQKAVVEEAGQSQLEVIASTGEGVSAAINTQGLAVIQQAQAWANKTDGPVEEDGEYSAKKYAQDAQESAQTAIYYAQHSTGKTIGEVYFSQSSLATDNPGSLPLFTGETIESANTIYPDFYEWVSAHEELQCTAEEYEAALSTYGECAKYVVSNGSLRLPLIKNYIKAANLADGIKNIAAGLPNITGSFTSGHRESADAKVSGAFYTNGFIDSGAMGGDQSRHMNVDYFNASRSSSVYGKSSTVTPASTTLYPWVVAFNAAVEASTAQAAQFQQALSGKVSKNGDILTGQLVLAEDSNSYKFLTEKFFPAYNNGVQFTWNADTTYTAPANGIISFVGYNAYRGGLSVVVGNNANGTVLFNIGDDINANTKWYSFWFLVKKGQVFYRNNAGRDAFESLTWTFYALS